MSDWYKESIADVVNLLESNTENGLSKDIVASRLEKVGLNELVEKGTKSPWKILLEQFTETMVLVLVAAAAISFLLHEYLDAFVILIILILNAILGFVQEYKAEKAIAALKEMSVPSVLVKRDGRVQEVPAKELVPGDIVIFETGNVVPADCRLIESINLRVQESALTGESEPVSKSSKIEDLGRKIKDSDDIPLAERKTMVYMGSIVSYGRGVGIVTDTGMNTELGKIAEMMQSTEDEPTPLQRKLSQLGKGLALATIVLVFIIIGLGLLRGEDFKLLLLTSISIAVAAIPEGLPAIVTISLAMGARRMLEKQALIRKLPAVEALGSVTVICSDKTGTLTKNEMTVTVLDVANNMIELKQDMKSDRLRIKTGVLDQTEEHLNNRELLEHSPALTLLLAGGALCNDAILEKFDDENGFQIVGDPTEGALVVSAYKMGMEKQELEKIMPREDEIPFDSDRKRGRILMLIMLYSQKGLLIACWKLLTRFGLMIMKS